VGISGIGSSSTAALYAQQQQQLDDQATQQNLDDMLGSLQQLVGGQGSQDPLAQTVDQLKKALESGQATPQDVLAQLQQMFQQISGAAQDPSQQIGGVSGSGGAAPTGFSPQDAFQQPAPAAQNPVQAHGHHHHHGGHRQAVDAAADALGMSPDALRSQLQSGKSIADVANDRGLDVNGVESAIKTELQNRLPDASTDQLQAVADRIVNQQRQPAAIDPNAETLSAAQLNPLIRP
jgi:hypothetical protein